MNNSDNFEAIAKSAVVSLTTVVLTLRLIGDEGYQKLADAVAETAEGLCDRAIALGAR